jgi:MinD-like ATPase involved in chromosome partitioning or flagellar assembly
VNEDLDISRLVPLKQKTDLARVTTIISGKDGVGKSTIAANLAVASANKLRLCTSVLDLDLQYGDQSLLFRAPGSPNLLNTLESTNALDFKNLPKYMHQRQKVWVLPSLPTPEKAELINPEHVKELIKVGREAFDSIVLDVTSYLCDTTLEAIDASESVVLVTTERLSSIKDSRKLLKVLSQLGVEKGQITLVLNRLSEAKVSVEDIEKSLDFQVSYTLPYLPSPFLEAMADGSPYIVKQPRSDYAKQMYSLAALSFGSYEDLAKISDTTALFQPVELSEGNW